MSGLRDAFRSAMTAFRSSYGGRQPYGSLMQGGIQNYKTGMGTGLDSSESSFFRPTRIYSRHQLETLRVQSWAARKFIDIPVDDMLIRWREWKGDGSSDASVETMIEAEERHMVQQKLASAMKAGRLYGSSLLLMVTKEANPEMPLNVEQVRPGDLVNLLIFDRYSASVQERDNDIMSPTYGEPIVYRIHPHRGTGMYVHASRCLRFDGIAPNNSDWYTSYDYDWGVSELIPAMLGIMQDQTIASAVAHLTQEASIPVIKTSGLREVMSYNRPNEISAEQIGEQINKMKSVYRLMMLDNETEDFTRVAVNFGGLDKIQMIMAQRLAAAADIPMTRFFGQSPGGLNSTGDSDWKNYCVMVDAKRNAMLPPIMRRLDMVVARDVGLREPPEHEWNSLMATDPKEMAEVAKMKAEALQIAAAAGAIDEDEIRFALDGDPVFGALEGEAPGLPEPEPTVPVGGPMPNGKTANMNAN